MTKAILISPLAIIPAFVFVCTFMAIYEFFTEGSVQLAMNHFNNEIFVVAAFGLPYVYALVIFYGLPAYYLLKRRKMYNLKNILIAAIVPVVLLSLTLSVLDGLSLNVIFVLLGFSLISASVAYVFWLFAPSH